MPQQPPTIEYRTATDLARFIAPDATAAIQALRQGRSEVMLIPKSREVQEHMAAAVTEDAAHAFDWYNRAVKPEFRVPPPTPAMILLPHLHRDAWKPYHGKRAFPGRDHKFSVMNFSDGLINLYGSKCEDVAVMDPAVDVLMQEMTGVPDWKLHQNRLRVVTEPQLWSDSVHMEGANAGLSEGLNDEMSVIYPIGGQRSFVFYEGSAIDPDVRDRLRPIYVARGGDRSHFVKFSREDVDTTALAGRRRRIVFDAERYMLVFIESVVHEVDSATLSSSLFLSGYNPHQAEEQHAPDHVPSRAIHG